MCTIWPWAIYTSADLARLQGAFIIVISIIIIIIIIIVVSMIIIVKIDSMIESKMVKLQPGYSRRSGCGLGRGETEWKALINFEFCPFQTFSRTANKILHWQSCHWWPVPSDQHDQQWLWLDYKRVFFLSAFPISCIFDSWINVKQLLTKVRVEESYPRLEDIFDNSSSSQPSQGGQYNLKHIIHSIQHHLSLCLVGMETTPIEPWIATMLHVTSASGNLISFGFTWSQVDTWSATLRRGEDVRWWKRTMSK